MNEERGSGRAARFDVHVHLAGVGTQGSGCWASDAFRRRITFRALQRLMKITPRQLQLSIDQDWAAEVSRLVAESELDFGVALGFDGVYDGAGRMDASRSQLVIPDRWVFEVCRRHPNLLPAPSINPWCAEAIDRLDEAFEMGAVMIKWLPIVQAFDPGHPRTRPFLHRVAELGIPLLIHAGTGESTFRAIDASVGGLDRLIPALDAGITVVCAHTAAPEIYARYDSLPLLGELLAKYPNLWVDNSGLANPARFPHLTRFADSVEIAARTLHGSDYPVPSSGFFYPRRLRFSKMLEIQRTSNWLQRDLLLKRSVGFDEASFTRAGDLLANLPRWIR